MKSWLILSCFAILTACGGGGSSAGSELDSQDLSFLHSSGITLNVGETSHNPVTANGSGAITYTSSDGQIVSVNEVGNLTAIAAGSADITASIAADDKHGAASVTLKVTVRQTQVLLFSQTEIVLNVTETITQTPQGEGSGAITYVSNAPTIAQVDADGMITGLIEGTAQIEATIAEDDEYSSATAILNVHVQGPQVSYVAEVGTDNTMVRVSSNQMPLDVRSRVNKLCFYPDCVEGEEHHLTQETPTFTDGQAKLTQIAHYQFVTSTGTSLQADMEVGFNALPPITQGAMTYFNGNLWLLGGRNPSDDSNVIYKSADGLNWHHKITSNPFSARSGHSAVLNNGKLWIVGGRNVNDFQDSVWSSTDGINWTEASHPFANLSAVNFSAVKSFSYKNTLFALVGANKSSNNRLYKMAEDTSWSLVDGFYSDFCITSDVQIAVKEDRILIAACNGLIYYSDDGLTWNTEATSPERTLDPNNMGRLALYNFQGKFWAVGGYQKVYSSDDGITWALENEQAQYFHRAGFNYQLVHENKMWMFGGSTSDPDFSTEQQRVDVSRDLWQSEDGKNWRQLTSEGEFGGITGHELIEYNGKLWIIGGQSSSGWVVNETWKSENGVDWQLDRGNHLFPVTSTRSQAVVFNNKLWMLVRNSSDSNNIIAEMYRGEEVNGVLHWTRVDADMPFAERINHQLMVYDNNLWLLGGMSGDYITTYRDVWSSIDGETWQKKTDNWDLKVNGVEFNYHRAAVFDGKMWVIGGTPGTNMSDAVVASSVDGITWEKTSNVAGARRGHDVAVLGDKLLIYPGGDGSKKEFVYSITAGNNYVDLAFDKHTQISNFAAQAFKGRVWMIGGYDSFNKQISGQIWVSDDGINDWRRVKKGRAELVQPSEF